MQSMRKNTRHLQRLVGLFAGYSKPPEQAKDPSLFAGIHGKAIFPKGLGDNSVTPQDAVGLVPPKSDAFCGARSAKSWSSTWSVRPAKVMVPLSSGKKFNLLLQHSGRDASPRLALLASEERSIVHKLQK